MTCSAARRTPTTRGRRRRPRARTRVTSRSGSTRRRGSMATDRRLLLPALAGMLLVPALAAAQPSKLTVGIYAPTVEFGTAQARLAYAQGLAKAIEQNTGIKTEAQSYSTMVALKKDNPDYAIVDGICYATNLSWKLLANANIGGSTTRTWSLYTNAGDSMQALKGKKLAFIQAGC